MALRNMANEEIDSGDQEALGRRQIRYDGGFDMNQCTVKTVYA